MHDVGISTYQFISYYASAICTQAHTHTQTRILKPFEDGEPTGLKVDIAEEEEEEIQMIRPNKRFVGCLVLVRS